MSPSDLSWHTEDFPELRAGPPWVMEEMMASQPQLALRLLGDPSPATQDPAATIRRVLDDGATVTVCGCGSSEHAAAGIAAQLRAAAGFAHPGRIISAPAFSAALDPQPGLCIGVSHDGATRATGLALKAARSAGASTAALTAAPGSAVAAEADAVLVTPMRDRSWCHTVAYTSALLAGAALAAALGSYEIDSDRASRLLTPLPVADEPVAAALAECRTILCVAAGIDLISAREQALKIAEGARIPAVALELESVLHGSLAAHDTRDALIIFNLATATGHECIARRAEHVAHAAREIGLKVAAVVSAQSDARLDAALITAGRIVVPAPEDGVPRELQTLLSGAVALQRLTLDLAHARATNPDLIRREQANYRAAAAAAEEPTDW